MTGLTVTGICLRLGHSASVHFRHYSHVIDAIDGKRYADLDALVESARADLVFRPCSASGTRV